MGLASRAVVAAGVPGLALAPVFFVVRASTSAGLSMAKPPAAAVTVSATRQLVSALDQLVARSPMTLTASVQQIAQASGGSVGVAVIELGGSAPLVWSFNGGQVFTAASPYKTAAWRLEPQHV